MRTKNNAKMLSGFYPITNNSMLEIALNASYNTKLQSMRTDYYKHYAIAEIIALHSNFNKARILYMLSLVWNPRLDFERQKEEL